jgi:hypothetical protein
MIDFGIYLGTVVIIVGVIVYLYDLIKKNIELEKKNKKNKKNKKQLYVSDIMDFIVNIFTPKIIINFIIVLIPIFIGFRLIKTIANTLVETGINTTNIQLISTELNLGNMIIIIFLTGVIIVPLLKVIDSFRI